MMKTNIQIFKNEKFGEVRTMVNEKGEPFFVGSDVAKALGYKNSRKALIDHVDDEDKGVTKCDTLCKAVSNFVTNFIRHENNTQTVNSQKLTQHTR